MAEQPLCRIGVFYDGSYVTYARYHYYKVRKVGWLDFQPLHLAIEQEVRERTKTFTAYKVVYAAWFQGLFSSKAANEEQLRRDRRLHLDLLHAGIDPKYVPMSMSGKEKGVDVALGIDALQAGLDGKIDVAVLVTGDGDLVPVVRALMKQGVQVLLVHFEYEGHGASFINERLLRAANFAFNISALERNNNTKAVFRGLFKVKETADPAENAPLLVPRVTPKGTQ
jgi:uncharacterized LabA/DUF88 family protein